MKLQREAVVDFSNAEHVLTEIRNSEDVLKATQVCVFLCFFSRSSLF